MKFSYKNKKCILINFVIIVKLLMSVQLIKIMIFTTITERIKNILIFNVTFQSCQKVFSNVQKIFFIAEL